MDCIGQSILIKSVWEHKENEIVASTGPLPMPVKAAHTQIECASAKEWAAWLAKHHASADGVWLTFQRDAATQRTLTYAQAVEAALCYGWIDGQSQRIDEKSWKQRYT